MTWKPSVRSREPIGIGVLTGVALALSLGPTLEAFWRAWPSLPHTETPVLLGIAALILVASQRIAMLINETALLRIIVSDIVKTPGEEFPTLQDTLRVRWVFKISTWDEQAALHRHPCPSCGRRELCVDQQCEPRPLRCEKCLLAGKP